MAFRKPGSGIQHRAYREWDRRYHSPESERLGPFEIMDDVIVKYRLPARIAEWLERKIDGIVPHDRPSMRRNPAVSAVWPKMTSRQRWAAMEFAGISEMRARALSHEDWLYLPEDVKIALLRGWQMGSYGATKRRHKGETTRRMPVLTNPVAKPFAVQGSHTYLLTFKGGGWHIYEGYDSYADALDMATWLMKTGVAGVKGPVQTLILKPVNERRYTVFYRSARRVAANGTKGAYPFADKQRQYRSYTIPQLRFALKDAADTARLWKGQDPATENWYRDDVFTISDEIKRREGGSRKNPLFDVRIEHASGLYSIRVDAKNRREARRKANWVMHREGTPGGRIVEIVGMSKWPEPYLSRGHSGPRETYMKHGRKGVLEYAERHRTGTAKNPSVPVWMRSEEAFFAKFGATRERLARAIARLSDEKKQEFHRRVGKTFAESAVRWALKEGGMGSLENSRARKGASRRMKMFYVAPLPKQNWMVTRNLKSIPPSVGQVFKVSARSRGQALAEAKVARSRRRKS